MAFDFKKSIKNSICRRTKPEIVNVPKANYIAVRGKGNPNEEGGDINKQSVFYMLLHTH